MRTLTTILMLAVTLAPAAHAQVTPGKILIKLETTAKTDSEARARLDSLAASKDLGLALERRSVHGWLVATVEAGDMQGTKLALERLAKEKGVVAVDTVTRQHALRAPSDTFYGELWGFDAIGAELAWDATIGISSQRIGMVDTGINRDHIDLIQNDVRGFDFISDPALSFDGNGRDADYNDADPEAGFHGSHVAGTMSASADDGIGVPGLNWNAGLVTARALGSLGGDTVDISEAAFWMAGGEVPGVPNIGTDRVSVINLSLGSDAECSPFQLDVYSAIIESGVVVVAAAGNSGNFEPTGAPANCPGVIAVGAAGPTLALASYSNFDERIDVVAPGGNGFGDDNAADSILSVDGADDFSYKAIDGTSMASPHVAGVVSLMQAVNPRLSPRQIRQIMLELPFTCGDCNNESFLDAEVAVAQAQATDGELDDAPAPPGDGGGGGQTGGGNASCPPNAEPAPGGTQCQCVPGFEPNAALTACVSGGSGNDGDSGDDGCPPNSTPGEGNDCLCDAGFVVNDAGTGCATPGEEGGEQDDAEKNKDKDEEDEDDDDRRDRSASFSGCTSTGAPTSFTALAGLLLIAASRRRPLPSNGRSQRVPGFLERGLMNAARGAVVLGCVVTGTLGVGCAHAVRIESAPGAEILVNGKGVGTSPVTHSETTGLSDTVQVTARLQGKEKTVNVQRNDVDMAPIGAGAGIGAATRGTGLAVTLVSAFVFLPCAFVTGAASWGALAAAPAASWLFFSHKMPDVVKVDLVRSHRHTPTR